MTRPETLRPPTALWTGGLFAPLHTELIRLLRGLRPSDWELPTSARDWRVRDVAAHLLDGEVRTVSFLRDGCSLAATGRAPSGYDELVAYLDELNARWVDAARRISAPMLVELLDSVGREAASHISAVDADGVAPFAVAWAGEESSPAWLHIGREYTERWHHQDQIREAVGAPPLDEARWLRPVVDISMRALPHAYRHAAAPAGTALVFELSGEAGGEWSLVRSAARWQLMTGAAPAPDARVTVPAADAARILLHRVSRDDALRRLRIDGERALGETFADARAVMVRAPGPAA